MSARFDAVLFDAGGVLVLPDPTVLAPLLAPYGGDRSIESHRRAHYAAMAAKSRHRADEADWDAYNVTYVEMVGCRPEIRDHAVEVLDHTRTPFLWRWAIPETLTALAKLSAADVPIGVVSNASGQIERVLRHAEICTTDGGGGVRVRVIVDSHVVGVAKPDPRIFDRIAYVGDSVTMDVDSATRAGLHPLLLDPYGDHDGAEYETIGSVDQIMSMI
jgi:putative hydrolase of the HAD superfamily